MIEVMAWLLGFIGIGTLSSVFIWSRSRLKSARLYRFRPRAPLDIVVVTSALETGGPVGKEYRRVLVSFPTVEATVFVGQVCGALRLMKDVNVIVSENLHHDLQNDLVLLGGRIKNRVSRKFIDIFNKQNPDVAILREAHAKERYIKVGKWDYRYSIRIEQKARLPKRDVCLLLVTTNPFASQPRRAVLCAGFTSQGTLAAAETLSKDFYHDYGRSFCSSYGLPSPFSSKWPNFVAIIDVSIVNGITVNRHIIHFVPFIGQQDGRVQYSVGS